MATVVETLKPITDRLNLSASELVRFRADLDTVADKLPTELHEPCVGMSDEATKLIVRFKKLQETMRTVAKTPGTVGAK